MVVAAGPGCKVCSRPMVPSSRRSRRTLCVRRECKAEARRRAGLKGARSLWGRPRKTKRCPQCAITKPRTREHWSPAVYRDGEVFQWAQYCKPCMAALHRDRYRTNPELREKAKARAARQRREGRGQPTGRGTRRGAHPRPLEDDMPNLDPAPLVALTDRLAADRDLSDVQVGVALGFSARSLREWRKGRPVRFDVADTAVVRAGLLMADLWPELTAVR